MPKPRISILPKRSLRERILPPEALDMLTGFADVVINLVIPRSLLRGG